MSTRFYISDISNDDLEGALISVKCVSGESDCFEEANLLIDTTQCFITSEEC